MLSAIAPKACRAIHKSKGDWPNGPDIWAKDFETISRMFSDEKKNNFIRFQITQKEKKFYNINYSY
jgi:hypothetical protein